MEKNVSYAELSTLASGQTSRFTPVGKRRPPKGHLEPTLDQIRSGRAGSVAHLRAPAPHNEFSLNFILESSKIEHQPLSTDIS